MAIKVETKCPYCGEPTIIRRMEMVLVLYNPPLDYHSIVCRRCEPIVWRREYGEEANKPE